MEKKTITQANSANVYVVIQSHGLSVGTWAHYVITREVMNRLRAGRYGVFLTSHARPAPDGGWVINEGEWNKGLVINYGEGGATKWENRGSETFCAPPFKDWKLLAPPYNMAKTSSYRVKTTPKLFVPPLQIG